MALTITDRRTIYDQADTTTGWTGPSTGTSTADFAEATNSVTGSLAIATGQLYFTGSAIDLSDTLVYVWLFNNALQGSWTTGATSLILGDGTDMVAFHMGGGDRKVFTHLDGPVSWQCAVLAGGEASTMNTAGEVTIISGSFAAMDLTNIVDVGGHFITGSKALGGGYNVSVDIIRYGNDGIRITAGGSGTEGTFSELAAADRSTLDQDGHGIFREFQPVAYGCQGPLTFGDAGTATNSYFEDSGAVVVFENWNIGDDKYYLNVEGNTGSTNSFVLTDVSIQSAGPGVTCDFAAGFVNTLTLTGVSFVSLLNTITFSNSADASGHDVTNCIFNNCGQIDPGDVTFEQNTILSSSIGADSGAVLLDADGSANWSDLFFSSAGTGHAIEITAAGSYTLTNVSYTGYNVASLGSNPTASSGSTDAIIYNNSGGTVTLTIAGTGQNVSVRNAASSDTVVIFGAITKQVTVVEADGTPVEDAVVFLKAANGAGPFPFEESVTIANVTTTATVTHTAHGLATNDYVDIKGASLWQNGGVHQITVTTVNAYTYTITAPGSSPTGTITSTFVALSGTTNASGVLSMTRVYASDQDVTGWARMSTSPPFFKTGPINGTISSTTGFSGAAVLIEDQ